MSNDDDKSPSTTLAPGRTAERGWCDDDDAAKRESTPVQLFVTLAVHRFAVLEPSRFASMVEARTRLMQWTSADNESYLQAEVAYLVHAGRPVRWRWRLLAPC